MEGGRIRESFLRFFEERGHRRVPSSPLIPPPESGLLLTNAGMNQFIPYFLGQATPPFARATTAQKCFRALDIENVGHTDRHLTFFEMLGNFSFGDYFKRESCGWGLELVTERWGIDLDRLWVTVFETDDETVGIWRDLGIPQERIVRRGKDDNYWSTHAAGPGGPSSEIYVDRGPAHGPEGGPAVDEERFLEIWNHVFMQDQVDADENVLAPLPAKNIDTGASIERVAVVLQDVGNVFETDLLRPLLEEAESISGRRHGKDERSDVSLKILAEHGRACAFLIADGVLPSNEGRGYVLRRMIRRVVSHARRLGLDRPVMGELAGAAVASFGEAYPELVENRATIEQVVGSEEERFAGTLRQGMTLFEEQVGRVEAGGRVPGEVVFKLHDTFGFPKELTRELTEEAGLGIDEEGFERLMAEQRERAKSAAKRGKPGEELSEVAAETGRTEFLGYQTLEAEAKLRALLSSEEGRIPAAAEGDRVRFVLDRTPFYAESGGQVGDQGLVRSPSGLIRVEDAQFGPGDVIVHRGVVESGEVREGEEVHGEVDRLRREATARSHTATHVVHWTLRHVLGEHARQAGSLVAPGRLRFDFPHHSAVPRDVLEEAEAVANARLAEDAAVHIYETTFEEAKNQGAIALFGEKYGDFVRVVEVGDFSIELCGGTHVPRTGNVALIRILGEGSIGSGMRRVEALVGPDALREINLEREALAAVAEALGTSDLRAVPDRVRRLVETVKRLESDQAKKTKERLDTEATQIASRETDFVGDARLVRSPQEGTPEYLRELAQRAVQKIENPKGAAVVLWSRQDGRGLAVAAVSANLQSRGVTAPELLQPVGTAIGGGAGGKPGLAFAGGSNAEALKGAVDGLVGHLEGLLGLGA